VLHAQSLLASIMLVATLAVAADAQPATPGEPIDETRAVVGKWAATQELVFQSRRAWEQEKVLLAARVEALGQELAEAEQRLADNRKLLADQRLRQQQQDSSAGENEDLSADVASRLAEFERGVRQVHALLPQPTVAKVDPLYRRIPEDPTSTKVSLAERFQNVLGILNDVNQMNGEILLADEIRPLSDGTPAQVKTVYVGLGQAYFISARGEAGVGHPTPDGWVWTPANALSREINVVIQMLQNKIKPQFVSLPVTLQ